MIGSFTRLSLLAAFLLACCSLAAADTPTAKGESAAEATAVAEKLPGKWAHIEIKGSYPDAAEMPGPFSAVAETLSTGVGRLTQAAKDKEIGGVVLRIRGASLGWAKLHEFRTAVQQVRASGRPVVAVVDDAETEGYLLACACDRIIMPESGSVMVLGIRAEVAFYRNLFDKLGVRADMVQIGDYKAAAEPYTRTDMSPAFREEMEAVIDSYFDQIVRGIADGRGLGRDAVLKAIDEGPYGATAAKELGLIDNIAYSDEVEGLLKKDFALEELKFGYGKREVDTDFSGLAGMMKMMNLMMGVEQRRRPTKTPKIAVIHTTGVIMPGRSTADLFGGEVAGSDTIIKAIRSASDDDSVKAIVLRIDSPGGSALASDLIWRELKRCKKPVVASMGNTAASGGYYIAVAADTIFAEPGTLTGSIGVVGGKVALGGLYDKLGISTSVIQRGRNSGLMSSLTPFTDEERTGIRNLMLEIYGQFTTKVAEGRGMELATVEQLAQGRVYTGEMALKNKLVDRIGTLDDAVAFAMEKAELAADTQIERLEMPAQPSPFEALFGPLDPNARSIAPAGLAIGQAIAGDNAELFSSAELSSLLRLLTHEHRFTMLPYRISIR